jgi:hypothetical protein
MLLNFILFKSYLESLICILKKLSTEILNLKISYLELMDMLKLRIWDLRNLKWMMGSLRIHSVVVLNICLHRWSYSNYFIDIELGILILLTSIVQVLFFMSCWLVFLRFIVKMLIRYMRLFFKRSWLFRLRLRWRGNAKIC